MTFEETQNLCWRMVLEGLHELFKFNTFNYFKIKNILIVNINLLCYKKLHFQKT